MLTILANNAREQPKASGHRAAGDTVRPTRGNYAGITSTLLYHITGNVYKAAMAAYPHYSYYLHTAELL